MFISSNLSRALNSNTPFCFFEPEGTLAGGETPPAVPSANPAPQLTVQQQIDRAIADVVARTGSETAALTTLIKQNHALETRAKAAEDKVGQVPSEVTNELAEYRALGKPAELKTRLENETTLVQGAAERAKKDSLVAACKHAGIDADSLQLLAGALDAEYSVKTEKQDGKDVPVGYAKFKDENGAEVEKPVGEFIAAKYPTMADKLKAVQSPQRPAAPLMGVNTGDAPAKAPNKPAAYSM